MDAWMEMIRSTGSLWIYALSAAIAVSFAGDVIRWIWQPLWSLTIQMAAAMLGLFVSPVTVDHAGRILAAPHFEVQISQECAGFEGMGLILAFGSVWLFLFRKECRFPQALLVLPAGVAAMYLLNAVRITVLMLIGNAGAPQIALGGFHSQAGWIAFTAASLGLCFAARRVPWIAVQSADTTSAGNPSAAYLIPFLAILATGMAATALSARFEWLYSLRFFAAAAALYFYRDSYRALDWRFSWRGLTAGGILFLVWIGLDRWSGAPAIHQMPPALAAAPAGLRMGWITLRTVAAVITVPIAEELAFRGFLLRRLRAADFETVAWRTVPWTALVVSSLLFGLMHGQRWLAGTAAGLLFGWLAIRRERIGEAVAAHAATNALIAIYVLTAGQWQLW
jgi:exosortase E/protease (VPEID-CTERM system)